ncbi:MAG: hypothetical protein COB02_14690 [Candidatus Cloacimonadota bacterium]|nr:MAG: hypothetical protein COB02_14690 [Candidatus Cloacimonadota bacterium]
MGFAASLSFLCFSFLYLIFGVIQWPLLIATFFLYWLQTKYDKDKLGKSFYLLDIDKIVDVKHELLALPTRVKNEIAFVQDKSTFSLYNIKSDSFIHQKMDVKLMPMSAFYFNNKWAVWAKTKLIILDRELNIIDSTPLIKCGVSLIFLRDHVLYAATTNEKLISYKDDGFSEIDLFGIAYQYHQKNDYILTSQGIIYKYIDKSFQKQNDYLKEVLSASMSDDLIFMYKSNSQILKQRAESLSNLSSYHKEFGFPEIYEGFLYFINIKRELIQIDNKSQVKVLKTYEKSPMIHRKVGHYLLLLFEFKKSTQIEIFDYKSQKSFSFVKEGYFSPLGLSELSFDFSFDMKHSFSWKWGEAQPIEKEETLSQVLHFNQKKFFLKNSIWSDEKGQELKNLKTGNLEINFDFQKVGMIPAIS